MLCYYFNSDNGQVALAEDGVATADSIDARGRAIRFSTVMIESDLARHFLGDCWRTNVTDDHSYLPIQLYSPALEFQRRTMSSSFKGRMYDPDRRRRPPAPRQALPQFQPKSVGAPAGIVESEVNGFVYFAAAVAALGGLLFGYDTGVVSGAILFIKTQFSLWVAMEEIVVSSVLVGAVAGAAIGGALTDRFGRRKIIVLAGIIFTVSALGTALAPTIASLIAAPCILPHLCPQRSAVRW